MGNLVEVKYVKAPAYTRAMASGVTVAGPSPDGFVHLVFWRESINIVSQTFEQEVADREIGGRTVKVKQSVTKATESFPCREEVATLLVPIGSYQKILAAMGKLKIEIVQATEAAVPAAAAPAPILAGE